MGDAQALTLIAALVGVCYESNTSQAYPGNERRGEAMMAGIRPGGWVFDRWSLQMAAFGAIKTCDGECAEMRSHN